MEWYGFRYNGVRCSRKPLQHLALLIGAALETKHAGIIYWSETSPIAIPSQSEVDTGSRTTKTPWRQPYPWIASQALGEAHHTPHGTWYDSDNTTNGGYAGAPNDLLYSAGPISSQCAYINDGSGSNYCNTASYIDSLNSRSICGITVIGDYHPLLKPAHLLTSMSAAFSLAPLISFLTLGERLFTHSSSVKQDGSARCIDQSGWIEPCNKKHCRFDRYCGGKGGIE